MENPTSVYILTTEIVKEVGGWRRIEKGRGVTPMRLDFPHHRKTCTCTDELPVHSLVPTLRAKEVEGGGYY